jgi:arsenate reductase
MPKVVFVCLHGSAKSVLAAADFEKLAAERGIAALAVARGLEPDAEVPQPVQDALAMDGLRMGGYRPQLIDVADLADAWRTVTFGCDLPFAVPAGAGIERWDDVPAVSEDLALARQVIGRHLERLVAEAETWAADAPARRYPMAHARPGGPVEPAR